MLSAVWLLNFPYAVNLILTTLLYSGSMLAIGMVYSLACLVLTKVIEAKYAA